MYADQSTAARKTDPVTSHDAARDVAPGLNKLQTEVLKAFAELGPMTDATLTGLFSERGFAESTVRKRRSELTARGKIINTGDRDGRHAVWAVA